ncbi:MAG: B-box zinc finger protein [Bacteroidota bacterium]
MKCKNHQDREALSYCHSCGEYFCRECLEDGEEYYYCFEEECQNAKLNEREEKKEIETLVQENIKERKEERKSSFLNYLYAIPGVILGKFLGWSLIFPFIGIVIGFFILSKYHKFDNSKPFYLAFIIQLGQLIWFILGISITLAMKMASFYDIATLGVESLFYAILLIWFLIKPNLIPGILLTLYQVFGLVANFISLTTTEMSNPNIKSLIVHIILRVIAVVALVVGLSKIKNNVQFSTSKDNQSI